MATNIADKAVAQVALTAIFEERPDVVGSDAAAELLITAASKVRFQPSTRQLVLTFDLAFGAADTDQASGPVE